VCLNGAAARLVHEGDRVIIVAYAQLDESEAVTFAPRIVVLDGDNAIVDRL